MLTRSDFFEAATAVLEYQIRLDRFCTSVMALFGADTIELPFAMTNIDNTLFSMLVGDEIAEDLYAYSDSKIGEEVEDTPEQDRAFINQLWLDYAEAHDIEAE